MTDETTKPVIRGGPSFGATKPIVTFLSVLVTGNFIAPWLNGMLPPEHQLDYTVIEGFVAAAIIWVTPHNLAVFTIDSVKGFVAWRRALRAAWEEKTQTGTGDGTGTRDGKAP